VLRELLPRVPGAHYIYLGDTARLPYGAKSQTTIARYAVESARFLEEQGAEHLVIACNTASALALDEIRDAVGVPVQGVIEPGAQAAQATLTEAATAQGVLVLATEATVQSHAYRRACEALGLRVTEFACPLLVPLVEEGWTDHPVTREVLRIYIQKALQQALEQAHGLGRGSAEPAVRAVVLGCTHYPLIAAQIEGTLRSLGSRAVVVDAAAATAAAVAAGFPPPVAATAAAASFTCYATDSVEKFRRLGSQFLGQDIPAVRLLDLGG